MALIQPDTILDQYSTAKQFISPYTDNFHELERVARNKPHANVIKAKLPTVTDGTTAAAIKKAPRRVIQQVPIGQVKSLLHPEIGQVVNFYWENNIIPNIRYQGDMFTKCLKMVEKSLTYGGYWSMPFYTNYGEWYGPDFRMPYIMDVFPEPGQLNVNDSNYIFLRSWWTKADIQRCIDKQKKLKKSAKEREENYDSEWNLKALSDLKEHNAKGKDTEAQSPSERNKAPETGYIELVHCFQVGIDEKFYTYSPDLKKVVRTWKNPDPRGRIPLHYMYYDMDLSNPLGYGAVELVAPLQNMIDSQMQSYQFMAKLMEQPPVKKYGNNIVNSSIKWKSNAVWEMGGVQSAGNDIVPVSVNTFSLQNYANIYGLNKSQILNLVGNNDTSISADVGNPGFSKTDSGVKQQASNINIDDNYLTKQFGAWFQENAETMINLDLAIGKGIREVEVTEAFLDRLPEDFASDLFEIPPVNSEADLKNMKAKLLIGQIDEKFKFEVEAGSTSKQDEQQQGEALNMLLERYDSSPTLQQIVPQQKIVGVWNKIVSASGVEDPEKLQVTDEDVAQQQAEAEAAQQAQMEQQQAVQAQQSQMQPDNTSQMLPPEGMAQEEAMGTPMDAPIPMPQEDDPELMEAFQQAGFPPELAQYGIQLHQQGMATEEVLQVLAQAVQGDR